MMYYRKNTVNAIQTAEVGVVQNSSQVAQIAQVAQMRNLRCGLCLFFQRLRNLRLRIGKSNICCASIGKFFPRCAVTK